MTLIDSAQFSAIASCGAEAVKELLESFKEDFTQKLSDLENTIPEIEPESSREVLHQLKGTSATFGMKALNERIAELEHAQLSVDDIRVLRELTESSLGELDILLGKEIGA